MCWKADVPEKTRLKFRLRWAEQEEDLESSEWRGPGGPEDFYDRSGQEITGADKKARWLQYKAVFISPDGCRSPKLTEVCVYLEERKP